MVVMLGVLTGVCLHSCCNHCIMHILTCRTFLLTSILIMSCYLLLLYTTSMFACILPQLTLHAHALNVDVAGFNMTPNMLFICIFRICVCKNYTNLVISLL